MRDFQALKFLIGVFEGRVVVARIRITFTHSFTPRVRRGRARRTDERTNERTNDVDGCEVYDGAGASAGVRVEWDGTSGE